MFFCNECGEENGWTPAFSMKSYGPCEMCGKQALCHDISSSQLPISKKKRVD